MSWTKYYEAPVSTPWQGRADTPDAACLFQLIKLFNLQKSTPIQHVDLAFAIIGFCCDEGIRRNLGRVGAAEGPYAIREFLARLPMQKSQITCYDVGNITCTDGDLEGAQLALADIVAQLLAHDITPIIIGGGHEVAWGTYLGIEKIYPKKQLGIINFDAHFDMRPILSNNQGNSGTPFLQIAKAHAASGQHFDYNCMGIQPAGNTKQLFDTAASYQVQTILADDLHQNQHGRCVRFIERIIEQNEILYTSLCLDVFAAAYAPGVSAPQSLGLTPWQVLPYVRQLALSGKVVSYDIAELSPPFDRDQRTAKLAASFVFEIIHYHKKLSKG